MRGVTVNSREKRALFGIKVQLQGHYNWEMEEFWGWISKKINGEISWTVVVMCGFGSSGSCTGIGDASSEPDWRTHTLGCGAGKGKKLFSGTTVLSDCVCVSNHAAAVQATTREWESFGNLWIKGFFNSFLAGCELQLYNWKIVSKVVSVLQWFKPLQIILPTYEHAHPTTSLPCD